MAAEASDSSDEHDAAGEPAHERPRSMGRNAIALITGQVVTSIIAIVTNVVQPRFIGPDGVGQLRIAVSLWLIAEMLFGLGTATLLALDTARDHERGAESFGSILRVRLLAFAVCWIGVLVLALASGYERDVIILIVIMSASSLVSILGSAARAALTGFQAMDYPTRADVASKFFTLAAVLVVLALGGRTRAIATVYVAAAVLNAAMMARYLSRFPGVSYRGRWLDWPLLRRSLPYLISSAALVVYIQVDTFVMSLLVDERAIGWYAAADTLFGSMLFLPTVIVAPMFPVLAKMHKDGEDARDLLVRRLALMLLVATPVGLGTIVVARPATDLLFGDEFHGAAPVLAVYGVVLMLEFGTILLGSVAVASDGVGYFNRVMLVAIAMTIVLDPILVPLTDDRYGNGAIGGALSYVITEGFILTAAIVRFGRWVASPIVAMRAIKVAAAGALMMLAAWPLRGRVLAAPVAVGAAVYIVVLVALRTLSDEERQMTRRVVNHARGRLGLNRRSAPDAMSGIDELG